MSRFKFLTQSDQAGLAKHVHELRSDLSNADPSRIAAYAGCEYRELHPGSGTFSLKLFGSDILIDYPQLIARDAKSGSELPVAPQALLLYYLKTADGTPLSGLWVSFSELPEGRFYNSAFQGYTGKVLADVFGDNAAQLKSAAEKHPAYLALEFPAGIGDLELYFQALPCLPLLLVFWPGDEDFVSSYQLLFDASTSHYLPTDVCAITGSMLTRQLTRAR